MSIMDKLFNKSKGKVTTDISEKTSRPVKASKDRDEHIKFLLQRAEKLGGFGWSEPDNREAVSIHTELLDLIDEDSPYITFALRNRAVALNLLKNYDAALPDIRRELEIRQRRGPTASEVDELKLMECQDFLQETLARQRKAGIEASGSETAQKFEAMEQQARKVLMDMEPEASEAFESLFTDLQNDNPDVRAEGSRLLADCSSGVKRLISVYQECLISDPRRASLAGRVLGRNIAGGSQDVILAPSAQMRYGIAASFISSTCVYCGILNRGIAAPPAGPLLPYYHRQKNDGAYVVPVLCDQCGKEFFVAWEKDPR